MYLQGDSDAARERDRWLEAADARAQWWIAFTGSDAGDLVTCLALLEVALKASRRTATSGASRRCLWRVPSTAHVRSDASGAV